MCNTKKKMKVKANVRLTHRIESEVEEKAIRQLQSLTAKRRRRYPQIFLFIAIIL